MVQLILTILTKLLETITTIKTTIIIANITIANNGFLNCTILGFLAGLYYIQIIFYLFLFFFTLARFIYCYLFIYLFDVAAYICIH